MPRELVLEPTQRGPLRIYPIEPARALGVDAFVTGRAGGVSEAPYDSLNLGEHVGDRAEHVATNRRRVARALAVDPHRLVFVRQVHGAGVLEVSEPVEDAEADALISSSFDLALGVLVADCVPILLVDARSSRFGVVHAGWRGLHAGVIARAIEHFERVDTLHAFIGPSISVRQYQVGPEVAELFADVADAVLADHGDRSRLDLRRVVIAQLGAGGLELERISATHQNTDGGAVFFSDRAARPCGRFALVAKRAS